MIVHSNSSCTLAYVESSHPLETTLLYTQTVFGLSYYSSTRPYLVLYTHYSDLAMFACQRSAVVSIRRDLGYNTYNIGVYPLLLETLLHKCSIILSRCCRSGLESNRCNGWKPDDVAEKFRIHLLKVIGRLRNCQLQSSRDLLPSFLLCAPVRIYTYIFTAPLIRLYDWLCCA